MCGYLFFDLTGAFRNLVYTCGTQFEIEDGHCILDRKSSRPGPKLSSYVVASRYPSQFSSGSLGHRRGRNSGPRSAWNQKGFDLGTSQLFNAAAKLFAASNDTNNLFCKYGSPPS